MSFRPQPEPTPFRRLFEEMRFLPEGRHKKTRLVRSGLNVFPQTEAGKPIQLTVKYYAMSTVNANHPEWSILRGSICGGSCSSPPLTRHERIKVLVEKQVVLFQCPGWSGKTNTIDVEVAAVTGSVRAISGVPALYGANG